MESYYNMFEEAAFIFILILLAITGCTMAIIGIISVYPLAKYIPENIILIIISFSLILSARELARALQ